MIASLTNFWIAAFRLPSACVKEHDKICAAFLWSGPSLNSRKNKVVWKDVCKPKDEGGLGLKSVVEMNKVSCFKLIWRIVSGSKSLWVNWITRELIRSSSFWSVKETTTLGSWMWRKLLKYRSQAKEFHSVEIKSGMHTSFWYDHWCPLGRLHDTLGDRGFIDFGISSDVTVAAALQNHRTRHHRVDFLNRVELELERLRNRGHCSEPDIFLWRRPDNKFNARFTTSETWQQIRTAGQRVSWVKSVWFSDSIPKHSFLTWLAAKNRLSTGECMVSWNMGVNPSCVFCQAPMETREHIFFSCAFSSRIWEGLASRLLQRRYTNSFFGIISLLSDSSIKGTLGFIIRILFQATVHTLWLERNKRKHGESPSAAGQIIKFIDRIIRNRISSIRLLDPRKLEDGLRIWFESRT